MTDPFNEEDMAEYNALRDVEKVAVLESELAQAKRLLAESQSEVQALRGRLRSVLWDYVPKMRKAPELPAVSEAGSVRATQDAILHVQGFEVGRFLGKGSFGKVVEATHRVTGDKVAIKVLDMDQKLRLSDVLSLELF